MSNKNIKELIKETSSLYWWVPEEKKEDISVNSVVENILNYGDEKDVKRLFDTIGLENVADIFFSQISGTRCNYFPQVVNFFTLYFQRHVQKYPNTKTD